MALLIVSTIYKAAISLCLSVPPFFRHDRRTATKFGTHSGRYGTYSQLKNVDPPRGGGVPWGFLGGKKIKSRGNVMNYPENQQFFF